MKTNIKQNCPKCKKPMSFSTGSMMRTYYCSECKEMKFVYIKYKYLTFIELDKTKTNVFLLHTKNESKVFTTKKMPKTKVFEVINKQSRKLGLIKWYAQWRRYCFYTYEGLVFDASCLEDIAKFIRELMIERIAERRSK